MSPQRHAVFGSASAADDALAAWKAADQKWRDTFAAAQAANAAGDQARGIALAAQSKDEFDRSVLLKKVLDDVTAAPALPARETSTVTLFGLWRASLNDWQTAVATKQDPKIVDGLSAIATKAQADYLKATPSLYRRQWDLNTAWANALHSPGTPPQEIAQLAGEAQTATAAFARMTLAERSADLNSAWSSAIHDPGTPPAFTAEVAQQAQTALSQLARQTKAEAARDQAASSAAKAAAAPSTMSPLVTAAIVTSPLWLFALLRGLR